MRLVFAILVASFASTIQAETMDFWPGASYEAAVPTIEVVTGHESGERITRHADVVRYFASIAMTYAPTVRNHLVTSLGTSETVAENREKFLREFHDYQLYAIDESGRGDIQAYILPTQAGRAQYHLHERDLPR